MDARRDWQALDRSGRLGSLVQVADGHARAHLLIDGMHCGACALSIERSIGSLSGVTRIDVSAATRNAQVTWELSRQSLGNILTAITALGFEPSVLADPGDASAALRERRASYKRLAVAGFGMMQVMTFAFALYAGAMEGIEAQYERYLRLVSMLVTTPVVLYSAVPFFRNAWRDLRAHRMGMDLPVSVAILLAFGASVFNTLRESGEVYFDSVTMFVFFLLLGRLVEMHARHDAGTLTQALARLLPPQAVRLRSGRAETVTLDQLAAGDTVIVAAGGIVPADGTVIGGSSRVDESMLTGESTPLPRTEGHTVIAGTLNLAQPLTVRVTATGAGTVLSAIVRMVERAQTQRPRLARAADRAAAHFVAWIFGAAILVAGAWAWFDPGRAFPAVLAVLVVTCPCALSLATPAAVAAVTGQLARLRLLVTRSDAIEALAHARLCVLDKTGTLTAGMPRVSRTHVLGTCSSAQSLALAAALEQSSEHPLAGAFESGGDTSVAARDVRVVPGAGVEGRLDDERDPLVRGLHRIGSLEFVGALTGKAPPAGVPEGAIFLGSQAGWLAAFEIDDALRQDAARAVLALEDLGLEVRIASGDHADAVARVAGQLGVARWHARLSPQDKLALVRGLGQRGGVLMVGDGINDAPVLNAASVSAAMGSGSALAHVSADFISAGNSLLVLPEAVREARRTLRVIRQNLAWALLYNLLAIPLAAFGLIPPWAAAIGMSASSILVVLNARRLRRPARSAGNFEAWFRGVVWPVCCC